MIGFREVSLSSCYMKGGDYRMAVFTLTLSKKIDNGSENDCTVSVKANSLTDDIRKNFEEAMSLFNDTIPYENE